MSAISPIRSRNLTFAKDSTLDSYKPGVGGYTVRYEGTVIGSTVQWRAASRQQRPWDSWPTDTEGNQTGPGFNATSRQQAGYRLAQSARAAGLI